MTTRCGAPYPIYRFHEWYNGDAYFRVCFRHNAWMESVSKFSINSLIHALLDREYKSSHLYSALLDALEAYEGTK